MGLGQVTRYYLVSSEREEKRGRERDKKRGGGPHDVITTGGQIARNEPERESRFHRHRVVSPPRGTTTFDGMACVIFLSAEITHWPGVFGAPWIICMGVCRNAPASLVGNNISHIIFFAPYQHATGNINERMKRRG